MSLASEITDLQTNLASAKNAVYTAGGTIGDTGLAGLESEIETIPQGGGGDEPVVETEYGKIFYFETTKAWATRYEQGCTPVVTDQAKASAFMGNHTSAEFQYYDSSTGWVYDDWETGEQLVIPCNDDSTTGVLVGYADGGWGMFSLYSAYTYNTGSPRTLTLTSINDYNALAFSSRTDNSGNAYHLPVANIDIAYAAVTRFDFGTVPTTTPNGFLGFPTNGDRTQHMTKINLDYATGLTSIGNYFLYGRKLLEQDFIFSDNVATVGSDFLNMVDTPGIVQLNGLTSVGDFFLNSCSRYGNNYGSSTPTLIFDKLTTVGDFAFSYCSSSYMRIALPVVTTIGNRFCTSCQSTYVYLGADAMGVMPQSWAGTYSEDITVGSYFWHNGKWPSLNSTFGIRYFTQVGTQFMYNADLSSLSCDILLQKLTTIPDDAFRGAIFPTSGGYGVSAPAATSIGNYFCAEGVNSGLLDVKLNSSGVAVGDYFLYKRRFTIKSTSNFNKITACGTNFMREAVIAKPTSYAPTYSAILDLSGIVSINGGNNKSQAGILFGLTFDYTTNVDPVTVKLGGSLTNFPAIIPGSTNIFELPVDFTSVTAVGGNFMCSLPRYNRSVALPNVTFPSTCVLFNSCPEMTHYVDVGSTSPTAGNTSFQSTSSSMATLRGILIKGANRAAWLTAYPDNTTRKLVDAGL